MPLFLRTFFLSHFSSWCGRELELVFFSLCLRLCRIILSVLHVFTCTRTVCCTRCVHCALCAHTHTQMGGLKGGIFDGSLHTIFYYSWFGVFSFRQYYFVWLIFALRYSNMKAWSDDAHFAVDQTDTRASWRYVCVCEDKCIKAPKVRRKER